jgi:hypothetical protein
VVKQDEKKNCSEDFGSNNSLKAATDTEKEMGE